MTSIERILQTHGPMMSSKLASVLRQDEGLSINTASQKVSRDRSILRVKGFYTSGQSFCYLANHQTDPNFFEQIIASLEEHGRKYWYCLNAIKMSGGILSSKYLECYTNYPVLPLRSHIPFKDVLQKFIDNNILIRSEGYYLLMPKFNQTILNFSQYTTLEMIKDDILSNFNSLTRNIGLVSYYTGQKFAEFGKFTWGFKGVCPINSLKANGKLGFVLADLLFGHKVHEKDIRFFIDKIKTIQSFNNASKVIPFLLVDDLEPKAFEVLKKNGVVVGFIKELFGQKYADTLKDLVTVLNNAGASLKTEPNKYLDLIQELKKYNSGLANNIKGTLFEFLIAHLHSIKANNSIDLGREIFENNKRHEIDVLAIYNDKVVFAECKATKAKVDNGLIEKWKGEKIPAFRQWANKQETWRNKKLEFEYWATSGFEDEAEKILCSLSKSATSIKVSYYNGQDIRNKAVEAKNKKLKEAVDNYFLNSNI